MMPFYIFQTMRGGIAFLTVLTLVRSLIGVNSCMCFEIAPLTKAFLTIITLIRPFFGVNSYMLFETMGNNSKTFLAVLTLVKFLFCMRFELTTCSKAVTTVLTLVRFFFLLVCCLTLVLVAKLLWQYSHW